MSEVFGELSGWSRLVAEVTRDAYAGKSREQILEELLRVADALGEACKRIGHLNEDVERLRHTLSPAGAEEIKRTIRNEALTDAIDALAEADEHPSESEGRIHLSDAMDAVKSLLDGEPYDEEGRRRRKELQAKFSKVLDATRKKS